MTTNEPHRPHLAVLIGSTRPGRAGRAVGEWVFEQASTRDDVSAELLDLADFDLPLLAEATVPGAAMGRYENPQTQAWSAAVSRFDGFLWVTPEYNHSMPGAMKNAFDVLYPEWRYKTVGLIGYGASGGVRAVEHWRLSMANAFLFPVRGQLELSLFTDWGADGFAPGDRRATELGGLINQVVELDSALVSLRS
ncbi:MAG: NAD(P)H-dependent oxidoreductase [Nocardioides sp.]